MAAFIYLSCGILMLVGRAAFSARPQTAPEEIPA
jgi:hypothetical protein